MKEISKYFLILLVCFCGFSCAWFEGKTASPKAPSDFIRYGNIIDKEILNQGGSIMILPFSAGKDIESNEELDKVALWLVRGIVDEFEGQKQKAKKFTLKFVEQDQKADFIIEGKITKKTSSSFFRRRLFNDHTRTLSASGKMIDQRSGKPVVVFDMDRTINDKTKNHKDLGRIIGQDLVSFILSDIK